MDRLWLDLVVTRPCCVSADSRSTILLWYRLISASSCSRVWNRRNRTGVPSVQKQFRCHRLAHKVGSPWSPSQHRSFLRWSPPGGRRPAAAPGTPGSADGSEAPPPRACTSVRDGRHTFQTQGLNLVLITKITIFLVKKLKLYKKYPILWLLKKLFSNKTMTILRGKKKSILWQKVVVVRRKKSLNKKEKDVILSNLPYFFF